MFNLNLIHLETLKIILIKEGLFFKVNVLEETKTRDGKEFKTLKYEVRRGPHFFMLASSQEEANEFVKDLNDSVQPAIEKYLCRYKETLIKELNPFKLGTLPMSNRRKDMELKNYAITARVILQENDASNKQVAIEGFLTFSVMAEDFDKASEAAEALLPMDEFKLTGVEEILA